ncbi:Metallo-dependent phosphatase-like protein [Polychytrium aggregatum]|uniref:Metallo-dependent phosphatase-like protein n=1 Tax=Polychytrium aggregatum TaxID=110093 RepID=UPI0022FE16DC|nr:Metallo-dependent phosphatase-like protein [Polychytrium aggregatum]KAI9208521.1 Metallo-dependent phosphatase-like protein [Polychytrium aggregatum]
MKKNRPVVWIVSVVAVVCVLAGAGIGLWYGVWGGPKGASSSSPSSPSPTSTVVEFADQPTGYELYNPKRAKLRFNKNGSFKIATYGDLHYGETPSTAWGPLQDASSTGVLEAVLLAENPDFSIYMGDQITGEFMFSNASLYYQILTKPLRDSNFRWAAVYGNHDTGPNFASIDLLNTEQMYSLSHTQRGFSNITGITNYWLPVYGSTPNATMFNGVEVPTMILWFFDSNGNASMAPTDPLNYNKVRADQTQWFINEHANVVARYGRNITGLAFFHIPPPEYQDLDSAFPSGCAGMHNEIPMAVQALPEEGFFAALVSSGTIRATYAAHAHGSGWCCPYSVANMELCQVRHTGFGGYDEVTWAKGSRIIQISESTPTQRTTWVRTLTGTEQ